MEEKTLLRKITDFIKNVIKVIIIFILSIFRSIFSQDKKNTKEIKKPNTINNDGKETKKDINTSNQTSIPDEPNTLSNPHNTNSEETPNSSSIILELPKDKLNNLNNNLQNKETIIYTYELLQIYIEEELERTYKDDNFKVKDASKEIKEKIKELEEKVIPKILKKIEYKVLTTDKEIKNEVEDVVKEEMKEKPLFPKKEEIKIEPTLPKTKEDIYFVAKPRKKELHIKENTPKKANKETKVISVPNTNEITEKLDNAPVMMVKNVDDVPKPTIYDNIKNATIATTIVAADITREFLSNPKENTTEVIKEIDSKIPKSPSITEDEEKIELPAVTSLKNDIEKETKSLEELTEIQTKLELKIEEIKKEDSKKEVTDKKEEIIKDLIKDTEISAISLTSDSLINDSQEELKKEEFDDKDYDRIERQIDKMLDDITNTYLRYESKMTPKQKAKLKAEEDKLRATREQIRSQKSQDLITEQNYLNEEISYSELDGLQAELKKIDTENKSQVSDDLFRRMEKLDGMTKEQVAQADKRIMLKHFNKASLLLEMTSLLALPFIRNKFFFAFTAGLIIDNHFNFVNAFFKRKINRYEPADLSTIKKGQDALNGALDITYKNLIELDYLEQQALSRYPELAYDPDFIKEVTRLRTNLSNKYNKLMKKNKNMEKYYMKTKHQTKVLKKDLKPEQK